MLFRDARNTITAVHGINRKFQRFQIVNDVIGDARNTISVVYRIKQDVERFQIANDVIGSQ